MGLFGGGNSSTSKTDYNTDFTDRRIVADGSGVGINADGSTVQMTLTDAGAIDAGRDVALYGLQSNATNTAHLLDTMERLYEGQNKVVDISANLAASMAARATNTADTGLKTQATTNTKTLLILGAVAAAALIVMRGGK